MNGNKNIAANFTIKQFSITLTSANGTITKSPSQALYDSNTVVQLTATPAPGYTFTGWSGDASGSTNPLSVTMSGSKEHNRQFHDYSGRAVFLDADLDKWDYRKKSESGGL